MDLNLKIVLILTVGFALASLFGYFAQKLKLPAILGYLLAGYVIGPYSPGFVADMHLSEQLAEIGVILMLFGVGLHFKVEDLSKVKHVAIPGAIGQILIASLAGAAWIYYFGWPLYSGIIMGLAIGVASTVVLVRVLTDFKLLETVQGHIAVGWLIVEDIFTVVVLLMLPLIAAAFSQNEPTGAEVAGSLIVIFAKFGLLALLMFTVGHKIVDFIMTTVARQKSHELFTLTLLALTFVIATGSAFLFGTSIALGAFIAGMMIGKTDLRHQAFANSLPLKDVFAVIFFLSIGMLFNPEAIGDHFPIFIGVLAIILLIKPLAAFLIVYALKYPFKVALTVAIALAQIGEFSFILAQGSNKYNLLPDAGYDILVACALISIPLNPLLFRLIHIFDSKEGKIRAALKILDKSSKQSLEKISYLFESQVIGLPQILIVGYGHIGETVARALEELNINPIIIDHNIDTISKIKDADRQVIYGDATQPNILDSARIDSATLLVITVPNITTTKMIIQSARQLNPDLPIVVRLDSVEDQFYIEEMEIEYICSEKETASSLAYLVQDIVKSKSV